MTLLSAVNRVQKLCSLAVTSTVAAEGQETQNLLFALAQDTAESLMRRHFWPDLRREHTFTATTAATLQASGKPSDFDRIVPETMWNRTTDRQILGPVTPVQWQRLEGYEVQPTIDQVWMLRYDGLHIWPAPTAADTVAFEYMINTPVNSSGGSPLTNFAADTDVFVLPEKLLVAELRWRWLHTKGLPYAEEMKEAELRIESEINAMRSSASVHIAVADLDLPEGRIPDGSWPLP